MDHRAETAKSSPWPWVQSASGEATNLDGACPSTPAAPPWPIPRTTSVAMLWLQLPFRHGLTNRGEHAMLVPDPNFYLAWLIDLN